MHLYLCLRFNLTLRMLCQNQAGKLPGKLHACRPYAGRTWGINGLYAMGPLDTWELGSGSNPHIFTLGTRRARTGHLCCACGVPACSACSMCTRVSHAVRARGCRTLYAHEGPACYVLGMRLCLRAGFSAHGGTHALCMLGACKDTCVLCARVHARVPMLSE